MLCVCVFFLKEQQTYLTPRALHDTIMSPRVRVIGGPPAGSLARGLNFSRARAGLGLKKLGTGSRARAIGGPPAGSNLDFKKFSYSALRAARVNI